jgi:hypothetical protein
LSAILPESDTYDASVITPETSDTTYPGTVKDGRQALANRTNFLIRRLRGQGDTESLAETDATAAEAAIVVPSDAIMGGGNLLKAAFQAAANRTKYVKNKAYGAAGSTWLVSVPARPSYIQSAAFEVGVTSNVPAVLQTDVSAARVFYVPVDLAMLTPYATITRAWVYLQGVSHGGTLPANMPDIRLYWYGTSGSVANEFASGVDASASAAAYDTAHSVELSVTPLAIGAGLIHMAFKVTGEWGANAAGLKVFAFQLQMTPQ